MALLLSVILSFGILCYGHSITFTDLTAGNSDSLVHLFRSKEEKLFRQMEKKYRKLTKEISLKREKLLSSLLRQEKKISRVLSPERLSVIDSLYARFNGRLQGNGFISGLNGLNNYLPAIDSLATGINFLNMRRMGSGQLNNLSEVTRQFQQEWNKTQVVQNFINDRYHQIQATIANTQAIQMIKIVKKEMVYYHLQVAKYKKMLNNPDQALQAVLQIIKKQPGFHDFMSSNCQLAALFSVSNAVSAPQNGLQTRSAILQQTELQMAGTESNPQQYLQQQLLAAQSQIDILNEKINQMGGSRNEITIHDFKPNLQRTKTFFQRIEWGLNIQSGKPNDLFPVTSDVAIMIGYKLNDKSTVGIGGAYKMGWGKNLSSIHLTHQGVGLRSFLDIRLKGSFWITGGIELNHQQEFRRIDELKDLNAWQRSGLIGFTKKYKLAKKSANLQILWDFLSYGQIPKVQALKFRLGYTL